MRRIWKILLILIPLLIIIAAAAIALWHEKLTSFLLPVVETRLSEALGQEVRIGRISGDLVSGAVLYDVRVAEGKRLAQGALVRIKRVAVRYRLRDLIFGRQGPAAAVARVDVAGAELKLSRDRAGRWNIAPLLKPRPPPAGRFTGVINISDSTVAYTDESPPPSLRRPLKMTFVDLSGVVRPGRTEGGIFRLAAGVGEGGAERLKVFSSYGAGPMRLQVTLSDASLAQWGRRLAIKGVELSGGKLGVSLTGVITGAPKRRFEYAARAQVRDGAVRLAQIREPLRSLDGTALIAGDQVRVLGLSGAAGSMRFEASGLISGLNQPQLDLSINATGITADSAAKLTKLTLPQELRAGPATAKVTVRGSLKSPVVEGRLEVERAQFRDLAVSAMGADVTYRDGLTWLRGLRADAAGGEVAGEAWFRAQGKRVEIAFQAHASDLNLARALSEARIKSPQPVTGSAQAYLAGTYDPGGLIIVGGFEARDGSVGELRFSSAYGVAETNKGNLRIASGRIESPAGTAVIEGAISADRALDLEVRASDIDLATVARLAGAKSEEIAGTGYFAGRVSGTVDEPQVAGTFEATDAKFHDQQFVLLDGKVSASRTSAAVADLLAYQEDARYVVSAALEGLDRPRDEIAINGTVQVGYAHLANILAMAGVSAEAQGEVEASVQVGGTIGAPVASGKVELLRPGWSGWALDSAQAELSLSEGVVHLAEATARVGDSVMSASGQVSTEGALDIGFTADVELADLRPPENVKSPLDLQGKLTVSGKIGGTTKQPQITAQARSDRISVEGEAFADLTLQTAYSGETQSNQFSISFAQGDARFSTEGSANFEAETIQASADLNSGRLEALRRVLQTVGRRFPEDSTMWRIARAASAAPSPVNGGLDLHARFAGPWREPTGEVDIKTSGVSVGGAAVPDAAAALALSDHVIQVRSFEAREEPAYVTASGTIDLEGPIALEVDAYNLNAGLFEPWVGSAQEASGSADVFVTVSGTLEQPQIVGSMELAHLSVAGVTLDQLQVPRFEVGGESLVAEEIIAAAGPYVLRGSATIPISWQPPGINPQGHLSVAIDFNNEDLALLTRMTSAISSASGTLNGRVELTGSLDQPELLGGLTVSQGFFRISGQRTGVGGLEADIKFEGRRVVVQRLTGVVGAGGFQAGGEVGLVTLDPSQLMSNRFDLSITGSGLEIDARPAFAGKVDLALTLVTPEQEGAPPVLGGRVVLASGEIGIPQRPQVSPVAEQPIFNPRLDIEVVFQPALRVRTATISMEVSGSGRIGGQLSSLSASAVVESRRGRFDLPGATFRITYASLDATMSPPRVPAPNMPAVAEVRASIRLEAESMVRGYQVYLSMSGPLTEPNVEPKIDLRSVPALDEERLWAMVTGLPVGPEATAFGERTRDLLTSGLGTIALYPLERAAARALGLEELGVEYSAYEPMRLRVGTYLIKNLYSTYIRSLSGPTWDFTLAYQVLPTLSLGVRINELNQLFYEALTTRRF